MRDDYVECLWHAFKILKKQFLSSHVKENRRNLSVVQLKFRIPIKIEETREAILNIWIIIENTIKIFLLLPSTNKRPLIKFNLTIMFKAIKNLKICYRNGKIIYSCLRATTKIRKQKIEAENVKGGKIRMSPLIFLFNIYSTETITEFAAIRVYKIK